MNRSQNTALDKWKYHGVDKMRTHSLAKADSNFLELLTKTSQQLEVTEEGMRWLTYLA